VLVAHIDDAAVLDAGQHHIDTPALDLVARVQWWQSVQWGAAFSPDPTQ
jgi:hypothetical protein